MNYELYTLWAASIYALMTAIKALAKSNSVHTHPLYVRALPLMPAVIGALSGALLAESFGWPISHGAFFGIGSAGVAALSHSVHRQTIKGKDDRLDHLRDAAEKVEDPTDLAMAEARDHVTRKRDILERHFGGYSAVQNGLRGNPPPEPGSVGPVPRPKKEVPDE